MNHPWHPAPELKKLLADGIRTDIYLARESHSVFKTIGERVVNVLISKLPHHANNED